MKEVDFMKCRDCYLRYDRDEQTEFICKSNDYCKFIFDEEKANAHWEAYYVCSVCGEHSRTIKPECPFCHTKMNGKEMPISTVIHPQKAIRVTIPGQKMKSMSRWIDYEAPRYSHQG